MISKPTSPPTWPKVRHTPDQKLANLVSLLGYSVGTDDESISYVDRISKK